MDSEASDTLYSEPTGIKKWVYNTLVQQNKALEGSSDGATASEGSVVRHHYLQTTAAQPKGVLQDCPHADDEGIFNAFSPNAVLGIRSLPNALAPDYRQQLFTHLVQAGKERQATSQQQLQQQRQSSYRTASTSGWQQQLQVQIPSGTKSAPGSAKGIFSGSIRKPHRYSPTKGQFSTFEHVTSEYERLELLERFAKLQSKLAAAEVSPEAFVVRGCPLPAPHTPTFTDYHFTSTPYQGRYKCTPASSVYRFTVTPYQEVDHLGRAITSQQEQRQHLLHGAFVPAGGSSSPVAKMRAESAAMLQLLEKQLTQDWPRSFLKETHPAHGFNRNPFGTTTAAGVYLNLNTRLFERTVDTR